MPTLSDQDIRRYLQRGLLKIRPLKPGQIGPASVDLTLGNEWWLFKSGYLGKTGSAKTVDLAKVDFKIAMQRHRARSIVLPPGGMCLGKTLEKITMPSMLMGKLEGRSRYARMGLSVHITSAVVQPGSDNHQVLEIVNFAPFPILLHAGMRVSQVIFHELKSPTSRPYARFGKIARRQ